MPGKTPVIIKRFMEATDPKTQSSLATDNSPEVLSTLAEIGDEVNASLDLDEVLAHAAALIKRHIDYELFGVLMVDSDGAYLTHRFAIGYPPGLAENLKVPVGQGITGTAARTGHPVPRQRRFAGSALHQCH